MSTSGALVEMFTLSRMLPARMACVNDMATIIPPADRANHQRRPALDPVDASTGLIPTVLDQSQGG